MQSLSGTVVFHVQAIIIHYDACFLGGTVCGVKVDRMRAVAIL